MGATSGQDQGRCWRLLSAVPATLAPPLHLGGSLKSRTAESGLLDTGACLHGELGKPGSGVSGERRGSLPGQQEAPVGALEHRQGTEKHTPGVEEQGQGPSVLCAAPGRGQQSWGPLAGDKTRSGHVLSPCVRTSSLLPARPSPEESVGSWEPGSRAKNNRGAAWLPGCCPAPRLRGDFSQSPQPSSHQSF